MRVSDSGQPAPVLRNYFDWRSATVRSPSAWMLKMEAVLAPLVSKVLFWYESYHADGAFEKCANRGAFAPLHAAENRRPRWFFLPAVLGISIRPRPRYLSHSLARPRAPSNSPTSRVYESHQKCFLNFCHKESLGVCLHSSTSTGTRSSVSFTSINPSCLPFLLYPSAQ